ncbi:hypothetical protein [Siphonobacter sp. SORGH_AS_0500]|uniref:hypothetical protein n=1 Tax=Siphonobacter sp. SORGH_AS_0500 TaxID=1864824 RepID=UPI00285DE990|nr:hypothetical protein [Siphonobacter sp. SORGH_AS_0500]MDR6196169.1 hypothetical protein [Siphonobacter sp. SORGH_AS_0500]
MTSSVVSLTPACSQAEFFGLVNRLLLCDARDLPQSYKIIRWRAERFPNQSVFLSPIDFFPESCSLTIPENPDPAGSVRSAEIRFETLNDSIETMDWLESLSYRDLYAFCDLTGSGLTRGFTPLRASWEFVSGTEIGSARRYAVTLRSKGQTVKMWYGAQVPANYYPSDPSIPINPGNPVPYDPQNPPNLNAFDEGFDNGFRKP